jgi:hypothetical protein
VSVHGDTGATRAGMQSPTATERDKVGTLGELKVETCGRLSREVLQGLKAANLISIDNVIEAII